MVDVPTTSQTEPLVSPGTSLSSLLGPHWSRTRHSTWGECAVLEDVLEHPWSKTRAESMPTTSSLELLKKNCDPLGSGGCFSLDKFSHPSETAKKENKNRFFLC
jgi:hypothetical protein